MFDIAISDIPDRDPVSSINGNRSAALQFISIPELRQRFLKSLGRKQLGRCMTGLGRDGMLDVIRELYRQVDCDVACGLIDSDDE